MDDSKKSIQGDKSSNAGNQIHSWTLNRLRNQNEVSVTGAVLATRRLAGWLAVRERQRQSSSLARENQTSDEQTLTG